MYSGPNPFSLYADLFDIEKECLCESTCF